jgi:A/G-specific adenine glycosylase
MAKTRKIVKKILKSGPPKALPSAKTLLAWYDRFGRDLPWRSHDGRAASPYHTWIAEIMLQQTTVATVIPYYERFLKRWPTVKALAKADEQDVLHEWAGLGYYSRARNLLKCAQIVAQEYGGIFPSGITELEKLPGIGDYTANAIRAIAFDLPANVVDGNVERVMARVFMIDKPVTPQTKKEFVAYAASLAPTKRPGDYAQALMDLGATVCTPKSPKCNECPWNNECQAFQNDSIDAYPIRMAKKKTPERFAASAIIRNKSGAFYLVKRPPSGLLGGLWEFPSTPWDKPTTKNIKTFPGLTTEGIQLKAPVIHVFTHFKLTMAVWLAKTARLPPTVPRHGQWFAPGAFPPVSTLTQKIFQAAIKKLGENP